MALRCAHSIIIIQGKKQKDKKKQNKISNANQQRISNKKAN